MEQRPVLKRTLGLVDAVGIGLGAIIGAGVFVAIGPAVDAAGSFALVAMLIAGVVALFNSLSSAQLAAVYPVSGGTYAYGRELINKATGFTAGLIFVIAAIAADSAIALAFSAYLDFLFPAVPARAIAVALVLIATALNYRGMRYSADVNNMLSALKVAALLLFIAAGASYVSAPRLHPTAPPSGVGILDAAAILFFAFTGYARIATLGEEVRDPEKTIPRAILLALGISAALYVGVLVVALGIIGTRGVAGTDAPLSVAAGMTGSTALLYIVSIGALLSTSTVLLTDLLGVSRVVFAMARNNDLPHSLSVLDPASGSPHKAVLLTGLVVAVLTAFLPLRMLVEAGSFGLLVYYGITNLAAYLLPTDKRRYRRVWAVMGFVSCLTLAFFLPWHTIGLGLIVILLGLVYFYAIRRPLLAKTHSKD